MPCYRPLTAYKTPGGKITFSEGGDSGAALELPCGRCIGCRIKRVQDWQMRITNEASMHLVNSFITLTYREEDHVPSLDYSHFQRFMRDLRRARGPVRFFAAGEYGEQTFRPHWHAILFGINFSNPFPVGKDLYSSKELENIWGRGNTSIGEVNATTAAYVASYCVKKITGPQAESHYTRYNTDTGEVIKLTPEMARMSLKPGIGRTWIEKYTREVYYARDGIVRPGGHITKPPRYYDKYIQENDIKQYTNIETERQTEAIKRETDNTTKRLQVKEIVALAKQSEKRKRLK